MIFISNFGFQIADFEIPAAVFMASSLRRNHFIVQFSVATRNNKHITIRNHKPILFPGQLRLRPLLHQRKVQK
jgi:hypothetical protein